MSDKKSIINKIIKIFDRPISKDELKTIKYICELATESDDVKKYHLRLKFIVNIINIILTFTIVYLLGKLVIEYYFGGKIAYA